MDYFTNPEKQPMTTCVLLGLTLLVLLYKSMSSENFSLLEDAQDAAKKAACKLGIGKCDENFGLATDLAEATCRNFPNAPGCGKSAEQFYYQAQQPTAVRVGETIDAAAAQGADLLGRGLQTLGQGLQNIAK